MKNPRTKRILLACVLAAGILFLALLCFYHLDYGELMDWDEARHGVSAYEMLQTGEPIVTTYAYSPDYWNLKPPLSEWLIALGYKLFGYNAYGLRFFSGVSMFLSTLLCAAFLWKRYGKTEAVFSLFAFASCGKLFYYHAARNGDADALFIFCYTIAVLCLCESHRKFSWTYGACLAFSFAFLAKGWHAGTIALLVLLTLLFTGRFSQMRLKHYALCALSSLGPAGLWALTRWRKDGLSFLISMFTYDVVNRATGSLENHAAPVYFYLGVLGRSVSSIFLILLSLFGLVLLLRSNAFRQRSAPFYDALVCVLAVLVPFVLFSAASSKLFWYILCVYPAIVLLSALAVHQAKHRFPSAAWPKLLLTLSLGLVVCFSAHNVWRYALEPSRSVTGLSLLLADCSTPAKAHYYIDAGKWQQIKLMETEWLTDAIPCDGGAEVFAADISDDALTVAAENFQQLGAAVTLRKADALNGLEEAFPERFDAIVSNPPYVPESDRAAMHVNVRDYEPPEALFVPDDDPLRFYRAIGRAARRLLRPDGRLWFEIYERLADETARLLADEGFGDIAVRRDINDKPRILCCTARK